MEEIYVNMKPVDPRPSTNQTAPSSSEKRFYGAVVFSLGLLSLLLLAVLIGLGVHHYDVVLRSAAQLSAIKANLTGERDLLNASLAEMTKELDGLKRSCPEGWRMFRGTCYLLSCDCGPWEKGRDDCIERGAHLVVINSIEEKMFLSNITKAGTHAWIGLTDTAEENSWVWVDGTKLTPQLRKYWRAGQPDNNGGRPGEEDCAHIITGAEDKNLNDLSCGITQQWICEKTKSV